MKSSTSSLTARTRTFCSVVAAIVSFATVLPTQAQIITLTDNGSTALINTSSQAGMFNWSAGAVNQLKQQWFWFRVGPSGPESSINTISAPTITQTVPYQATTRYNNSTLGVEVSYLLTGGVASSTLSETIAVVNNTAADLDLHFFQYMDFDLGGTPGGQSVVLNSSLARARQTLLSTGGFAFETAIQNATHREAALLGDTLGRLNDANPTLLNDNLTATAGLGEDVTFAFEWDWTIAAGDSRIISKIVTVPEPSAIALMALGLVGFILRRAGAKD